MFMAHHDNGSEYRICHRLYMFPYDDRRKPLEKKHDSLLRPLPVRRKQGDPLFPRFQPPAARYISELTLPSTHKVLSSQQ